MFIEGLVIEADVEAVRFNEGAVILAASSAKIATLLSPSIVIVPSTPLINWSPATQKIFYQWPYQYHPQYLYYHPFL